MKEFNLEEFKKDPSQKVVTRDGREVRIICTDAKGNQPIIALVYNNNRDEENAYTYYRNGCYYQDNVYYLDLFFAPIKREGWVNVYKDNITTFTSSKIHATEKKAEEEASEVLKEYGKFIATIKIATIKIEWEE